MSAGYRRNARRVVYENRWLRFEAHDMVHPNGVAGEHGVVVTPRPSAVVLVDGADVLLVRQARYAIDRVVLEVIKGGAHEGESELECAIRESREEAGLDVGRWDTLGTVYEIPSIIQEPLTIFLGRDLHEAPLDAEDVERIATVRMPLAQALDACADGRIDDAVTTTALFRASRFLARE